MNEVPVDIALSRLRALEQDWMNTLNHSLWKLKRSGWELDMIEEILLVETSRWVLLGQESGYFPEVPTPLTDRPGARRGVPEVDEFFGRPEIVQGRTDFAAELIGAQLELAREDRLLFLHLMFFADDSEWIFRLSAAQTLASGLLDQPWRPLPIALVESMSWFLTGAESSAQRTNCPANWRLYTPFGEVAGERAARAEERWSQLKSIREEIRATVELAAEAPFTVAEPLGLRTAESQFETRAWRRILPTDE
jgi:hypothetical protein